MNQLKQFLRKLIQDLKTRRITWTEFKESLIGFLRRNKVKILALGLTSAVAAIIAWIVLIKIGEYQKAEELRQILEEIMKLFNQTNKPPTT